MQLRPWSALLLLAALAGTTAPWQAARGQDEAPENPFAQMAKDLRIGRSVHLRGTIVTTLHLAEARQTKTDIRVGLANTKNEVLPLPGPAGVWHVRVTNREDVPLLVPTGTTLITPMGASRSTDRAILISPGAATFVPVVQNVNDVPQGPYFSRGRGLTPFEQSMIPADRWAGRVRARNQVYGVLGGLRRDDAAATYVTAGFQEVQKRYSQPLDDLVRGPQVVGIVVCDDRGPFFAHIQADATRFAAWWPFLRDGIALDAAMLERVSGAPRPGDESELRAIVKTLLRALEKKPLRRPNFGEGWEYRWPLSDPRGHWDGLGLADGPVSLRLYRYPERPTSAPPPPGTGRGPPEVPDPGVFEVDRRLRPTEYEKRLRERREGLRRGPGAAPRPSSPAAKPPAVPQPPRVQPPAAPARPAPPSTPPPRTQPPAPRSPIAPPAPRPPSPGSQLPGRR